MQFIKINPTLLLSEKHLYLTQAKADTLSSVISICDNMGIQSHVKTAYHSLVL